MSSVTTSYIEILNLVHRHPELIDSGDFAGVGAMCRHATLVFEGPDGRPLGELTGAARRRASTTSPSSSRPTTLQPVWANRYEDMIRADAAWRLHKRRGFGHMPGDVSQHLKPDAWA